MLNSLRLKIAVALTMLASTFLASAQGTAFTYQGSLTTSGTPANGLFDLQFSLYDAVANGNLIAGPLTNAPTSVSNGLFAVQLDFGSNVFHGNPYWLQIGARTNGDVNPYVILAPLQQVTPVPYAIFAPNAGTAQTAASAGSVAAANISGTMTTAQLPSAVVTNTETGVTLSGTFNGNGSGLINLNASQIASGTIPPSQLPSAVVTNTETGVTLSGSFSGNGGGLTSLNGSQITSGTINSSQLPTNAVVYNQVTLATNVYSSSGTYTFTVPPGATQIIAKLWGAGGAGSYSYYGGGGAFVQKTLAVTGGQTFVLVVGQRGDYGNNDLGGNGSGNAQGGSTMSFQGIAGGQGGQGSSLFYYSGSAYITEAVAGAGGGGGVTGNAAPGGNGGTAAGISYATAAVSGNNDVGGSGGSTTYASFDEGANGSSGGNYSTTATTTGVSSLSLVNGDGGNCGNSSGVAAPSGAVVPNGGGGGGGYGGGGGGAMAILSTYQYSGGGGGGGGSYGDIVVAGNSKTPGNTGDPNYVNSAGYGGTSGSAGSDGLIVLILQGAVANVPATVAANVLTANSMIVSSLTATNLTTSSLIVSNLQVNGMITGNGGGLTNLNASQITSGTIPTAQLPSAVVMNTETGVTLSGTFSGNGGGLGNVSASFLAGNAIANTSTGLVLNAALNAQAFNSIGAGAQFNFYDRGGFATYGQWSYFALDGRAYFWNSLAASGGKNLMSIDFSGNVRAAGSFIASTTPDLAETIPAAADVEAGDIVSADPQRPESVVRCDRNNSGVLGVISDGTSGFIINAQGKSVDGPLTGKPLVLAGRVPVKVSLENGPVKIGDYLTPSSVPGVAMRANGTGTVIGVALSPFDAEHQEAWGQAGKVLCFVKIGDASSASKIKQLEDRLQKLEKMVQSLEDHPTVR